MSNMTLKALLLTILIHKEKFWNSKTLLSRASAWPGRAAGLIGDWFEVERLVNWLCLQSHWGVCDSQPRTLPAPIAAPRRKSGPSDDPDCYTTTRHEESPSHDPESLRASALLAFRFLRLNTDVCFIIQTRASLHCWQMTREKKNHIQQFGSCAHLHIEALISLCEQWAECDHGVRSVEVISSAEDGRRMFWKRLWNWKVLESFGPGPRTGWRRAFPLQETKNVVEKNRSATKQNRVLSSMENWSTDSN